MKKIETATNLISDVEHLKKTVYTGNGEPSLISQIATLTTTVEFLEKSMNDKMKNLDASMEQSKCCIEDKIDGLAEAINDRDDRQVQKESRSAHLTAALIAGGISILVAIVSLIFKSF